MRIFGEIHEWDNLSVLIYSRFTVDKGRYAFTPIHLSYQRRWRVSALFVMLYTHTHTHA